MPDHKVAIPEGAVPEGTVPKGTVLIFDFGTRQIGVAVGQTVTGSARPLAILSAQDGAPRWKQVEALLNEWQPVLLLVGLPLNMDGSESDFCPRARRFGRRLHGRFNLPVLMVDERLSTFEAKSHQKDTNKPALVDDEAAVLIFNTWYREPQFSTEP